MKNVADLSKGIIKKPKSSSKTSPDPIGREVLVTSDFLRVLPGVRYATSGSQNKQARWLASLLAPALVEALGSLPEVLQWEESELDSNRGRDFFEFYAQRGQDASCESWMQLYNASPTEADVEFFRNVFGEKFVVGFELSPFQVKILEELDLPYLSLAIHPVRFMQDYLFQVDTNISGLSILDVVECTTDQIRNRAQQLTALYGASGSTMVPEDSALLCGQVEVDASLIHKEKLLSLYHFLPEIEEISNRFGTVLFKPHPYATDVRNQLNILRRFPNIQLTNADIYPLIANKNISVVSAISSSTLVEALHFGRDAIGFHPGWRTKAGFKAYSADLLRPAFWNELVKARKSKSKLAGDIAQKTSWDGILKSSLGVSWTDHDLSLRRANLDCELPIGAPILFGRGGDAEALIEAETLWPSEDWGRWVGPGKSSIRLRVSSALSDDLRVDLQLQALGSAEAPVTLRFSANGKALHQEVFVDRRLRSVAVRIPRGYISKLGSVQLIIDGAGGGVPSLLDKKSNDNRLLCFGIHRMSLQPIGGLHPIALGETVLIGRDAQGNFSLGSGWSHSETGGVWTNQLRSTLNLQLSDRPHTDVEISIRCLRALTSAMFPSKMLFLSVNGRQVGSEIYKYGEVSRTLRFKVPRAVIEQSGKLRLEIRDSVLISPSDLGVGNDDRTLGIFVEGIQVKSVADTLEESLPRQVTVVGPTRISTGLSVMTRNVIQAIESGDEEDSVAVQSVNFDNSRHQETDDFECRWPTSGSSINIFCGDVTRIQHFIRESGDGLLRNRWNICYGAWELENLPDYLAYSGDIQEYWGLSTFIANAAAKKIAVPAIPMPIPVKLDFPAELRRRSQFGLPEGKFMFLFTFCVDSTMSRKNPEAVFRAYARAFPSRDSGTILVFKCKVRQASAANQVALDAFRQMVNERDDVYLIEEELSSADNSSLYIISDAYVSLHRAEGFGLTIAEAMGYGKPAIATGYSGNLDFMSERNSCLIDFNLVAMQQNEYHNQRQLWADPDVTMAAKKMKQLVEDDAFREGLARAGQETILTNFSIESVGKKIRQRLRSIQLEA